MPQSTDSPPMRDETTAITTATTPRIAITIDLVLALKTYSFTEALCVDLLTNSRQGKLNFPK